MSDTLKALKVLLESPVPPLAAGLTAQRWSTFYTWARVGSVSVARLAEAHHDAVSILTEAGVTPASGAIYGVWASEGPSDTTTFDVASGEVSGCKPFASGVGVIDRALMATRDSRGQTQLVDIDVADLVRVEQWASPALVDTATGDALLSARPAQPVGDPGFYLDRAGFWAGAVGPAACWAGAASGVVDHAVREFANDPYRQAAQGALLAQQRLLEGVLRQSGDFIDTGGYKPSQVKVEALATRHLIERSCAAIVDRFSQAFGPRPFVSDAELSQRVLDVNLYCRQQHAESDLADLARTAL